MPPKNPLINNIGNRNSTASTFVGNLEPSGTIDPNLLAIQQMRALEPLGWRGGDNFFDGTHDDFCFVCGSSMELFGCQTCESCYHAGCMTPSLDPNEVPAFWFCPHCVRNELHIPSAATEEGLFSPLLYSLPMYPSPSAPSTNLNPPTTTPMVKDSGVPALDNPKESSGIAQRSEECPSTIQQSTPPANESSPSKFRPRPHGSVDIINRPSCSKPTRPKNGSPPRKKSKYSAFSKEVDKALSVIYSELETAAGYNKSENDLESKVQALEQQLKMQEGQMLLSSRELEFARSELSNEREESIVLKVDAFELREENARLKEELQRKEGELK